jgi:lipopolysaccharide cholinephosphotransferase
MDKAPLTLRERQLEYLRILKELDRYCNENHLRYYIGCGTLIGAVRHKGFIPWDDDLDVFMPRPDFIKMESGYCSDDFSLRTLRNDKEHPFNFGRLCSNNVYSLFNGRKYNNFGIDIYLINGAPTSRKEQLEHIKKVQRHNKRRKKLVRFRNSLFRRNLWPFGSLSFYPLRREILKAESLFEKYDFETSEYIWPFGGGRLILKKELYGSPIKLKFEDGLFNAPEHYDDVLRLAYGDYMQLPPEDKRHPYHGGEYFYR